jgi:hypothetical protein
MAAANVEIVRRLWEAAERGEDGSVFALYDPSITCDGKAAKMVEYMDRNEALEAAGLSK